MSYVRLKSIVTTWNNSWKCSHEFIYQREIRQSIPNNDMPLIRLASLRPLHTRSATRCFPPPGWTPPDPPPVFPTSPPNEFSHTLPGSNCIVGGGIYVNESFDCANYWFPSSGAVGGVTNLTQKLEGDDGDFLIARLDDFIGKSAGRFCFSQWRALAND